MKQTSWKLVFLVKMKRLFIMLLNKEGVWISPTSLSNQSLIDWPDIGIFWLKQTFARAFASFSSLGDTVGTKFAGKNFF